MAGVAARPRYMHILADVLNETRDPFARAIRFSEETTNKIRPIFDASLREDKNGIRKSTELIHGKSQKRSGLSNGGRKSFEDALGAAAKETITVQRGIAKTIDILENPGDFLKDPKISGHLSLHA